MRLFSKFNVALLTVGLMVIVGCNDSSNSKPYPDDSIQPDADSGDVSPSEDISADTDDDTASETLEDVTQETDEGDIVPDGDDVPDDVPEVDPYQAARMAFQLYYKERVERTVLAYNRFFLFGDTTFAINIARSAIDREGNFFEIVPGPKDNNAIGNSARNIWFAYKIFRSRSLALAAARAFEGMEFITTVSGHNGVTGRNAYPNWTMTIDGENKTVTRTRDGGPIEPPIAPDPALEEEIISTFFDGVTIKYRGEPEDILLNFMPANEVGRYSVTYSHTMLPDYLRVSDCCTSLMKVPEPYLWAGAYFSNHDSRDNYRDLAYGYLAAKEASEDPDADPIVRAAAAKAWAAGLANGDLIQANGGRIQTVREGQPWENTEVSGGIRPDETVEIEDLGSLSNCQMVYLARAISSEGLTLPLPTLPEPGAMDSMLSPFLDDDVGCLDAEEEHFCSHLGTSICGKTWGQVNELTLSGVGLVDMIKDMESETPGSAEAIFGHFYGNFDQPMESLMGVVEYARIVGDQALYDAAQFELAQITEVSRLLATLIYSSSDPANEADKLYWTALIEAQGGIAPNIEHLGLFTKAEAHNATLEAMLVMPDTPEGAPITQETIMEVAEDFYKNRSNSKQVRDRYRDTWGDTPPVRVTEEGYEARYHEPAGGVTDWYPVEGPHHARYASVYLLAALPLCDLAPKALDCRWAVLGCERPDLNDDQKVDQADLDLFNTAKDEFTGGCSTENNWCNGADLDHSGTIDEEDIEFMNAAQGCWW